MNTSEFMPNFPPVISLHQMISLVTDLETEICASPMYDRTIAQLTKTPKKEKNTANILKEFTRSVIRLACQRFMTQPKATQEQPWEFSNPSMTNNLSPDSTETVSIVSNSEFPAIPADSKKGFGNQTPTLLDRPEDTPGNATPLNKLGEGGRGDRLAQFVTEPSPNSFKTAEHLQDDSSDSTDRVGGIVLPMLPTLRILNQVKELKSKIVSSLESLNLDRLDRNEEKNQVELQTIQNQQQEAREHRLRQIGIKLRDARLSKSITIQQIHLKTAIAASQIEAIEHGLIDKVPEAVYLQSYLRKIANVVGLDGDALVREFINDDFVALPESEVAEMEEVESSPSSNYRVTSTHLFFGYLTLMSGAIGLLSSTIHPADSQIYTPDVEPDPNKPPNCQDRYHPSPDRTPDLNSIDYENTALLSISPPELLSKSPIDSIAVNI